MIHKCSNKQKFEKANELKLGNNKQCGPPLGVSEAYVAVLRSDIVGVALRTFGHAIPDFGRPDGLILNNVPVL